MIEPYLVQHKVRGRPAFDIAYKMNDQWIRHGKIIHAYWWRRLSELRLVSDANQTSIVELAKRVPMPDDWPDYQQEGE